MSTFTRVCLKIHLTDRHDYKRFTSHRMNSFFFILLNLMFLVVAHIFRNCKKKLLNFGIVKKHFYHLLLFAFLQLLEFYILQWCVFFFCEYFLDYILVFALFNAFFDFQGSFRKRKEKLPKNCEVAVTSDLKIIIMKYIGFFPIFFFYYNIVLDLISNTSSKMSSEL